MLFPIASFLLGSRGLLDRLVARIGQRGRERHRAALKLNVVVEAVLEEREEPVVAEEPIIVVVVVVIVEEGRTERDEPLGVLHVAGVAKLQWRYTLV